MLSYTCKTAIKAVIYLASKASSDEKVSIKDIAEQIGASGHTVGKILQTLARQGVIKSTKGPMGGFYMTAEQQKQPIINIVDAIDGRHIFKECGLGLTQCSENHPCPIHDQYKTARGIIETLFKSRTVGELCHSVNNGMAHLLG